MDLGCEELEGGREADAVAAPAGVELHQPSLLRPAHSALHVPATSQLTLGKETIEKEIGADTFC